MNEKVYATLFRGKQGRSHNEMMSLLWTKEGNYWKIVAARLDENRDAGIIARETAASGPELEGELEGALPPRFVP